MIEINANLPGVIGTLVPWVAIIGGLSLAFGIRYLKSKERMEMISRGMDPMAFRRAEIHDAMAMGGLRRRRNPLRGGFVALGVGIGLLLSYWLCHTVFTGGDSDVIYFGVVAVCVGLALILSHMLNKPADGGTKV